MVGDKEQNCVKYSRSEDKLEDKKQKRMCSLQEIVQEPRDKGVEE